MGEKSLKKQQSEEVDLGQLFRLIGNAFDKFFKFISSIFIGIYKLFLLLFVHIFQRFVWYVVSVLIGFIVGFIIDINSDTLYGANMYIQTNYKSARQVYENLKQFQQLAYQDRDTLELAKRFGISSSEASEIKGFYIEPDLDENDIAFMYTEFYAKLDSTSRSEMSYDKFKESLTPYNYSIHKIGVASTDKYIYKKIEKNFSIQLSSNPYLDSLLAVNKSNLIKKDKDLILQIKKTDSLTKEYLKIRISESKKEPTENSGGTNLYMGNAGSKNLIVDETILLERQMQLENQRRQINQELVEKNSIINILAGFPKSGYDTSEWTDKKKFVLPILLFVITLFSFLIFGFGKFLKNQQQILEK